MTDCGEFGIASHLQCTSEGCFQNLLVTLKYGWCWGLSWYPLDWCWWWLEWTLILGIIGGLSILSLYWIDDDDEADEDEEEDFDISDHWRRWLPTTSMLLGHHLPSTSFISYESYESYDDHNDDPKHGEMLMLYFCCKYVKLCHFLWKF